MKNVYSFLLMLLPIQLIAQPTINHMLDYHIGQIDSFMLCNTVAPGPAGAGQTWNFSSLMVVNTSSCIFVANPVGSPVPSANVAKKVPDSFYTFYNISPSETYTLGNAHFNAPTYTLVYHDSVLIAKKPITFNNTSTDNFSYTEVFSSSTQNTGGTYSFIADGYGTLILPNGTYSNVLRINSTQINYDTSSVAGIDTQISHFYRWYDDIHSAPLMDIDSVWTYSGGTSHLYTSAIYLKIEKTDVKKIENRISKFNASFNNDELIISGDIENGKKYQVILLNESGQRVYATDMIANSGLNIVTINNYLATGLYFVLLKEPYNPAVSVVKIVKQ